MPRQCQSGVKAYHAPAVLLETSPWRATRSSWTWTSPVGWLRPAISTMASPSRWRWPRPSSSCWRVRIFTVHRLLRSSLLTRAARTQARRALGTAEPPSQPGRRSSSWNKRGAPTSPSQRGERIRWSRTTPVTAASAASAFSHHSHRSTAAVPPLTDTARGRS